MRQLAALSLSFLSLAACATDPTDSDDAGGGGKADDTCESAAYATWLGEVYFKKLVTLGIPLAGDDQLQQMLALAEDMPCTTGADADFVRWFGAFDQQVAPVLARFDFGALRPTDDYAAKIAAAAPQAAELRTLTALIAVAPERSGVAGYKHWLDRYAGVLARFYTGAAAGTFVFERNAEINASEALVLQALEDARPDSGQELAYAVWFNAYAPWHDKLFATTAGEAEHAIATRLLAQRPSAHADKDYLTFFVEIEAQEGMTYTGAAAATEIAQARLDALAAARPLGVFGGSRSYAPWYAGFIERFRAALGTDLVVTDAEKVRLDRWIAIKPCSTNPADDTSWAMLAERRANFGEAASYVDPAKPTACE